MCIMSSMIIKSFSLQILRTDLLLLNPNLVVTIMSRMRDDNPFQAHYCFLGPNFIY